MSKGVLDDLLHHDEPSVRWQAPTRVLGENPDSRRNRALRKEIRSSSRVRMLLDGHSRCAPDVYRKWQGAHWVVASLADLGYPPGDAEIEPLACDGASTGTARPAARGSAPRPPSA